MSAGADMQTELRQILIALQGLLQIEAMRGANEARLGIGGGIVYEPDAFAEVRKKASKRIDEEIARYDGETGVLKLTQGP